MRTIAILNENKCAIESTKQLVDALKNYQIDAKLAVFTKFSSELDFLKNEDVEVIQIPEDKSNRPKMKNFVAKHFKESGYDGWLHVIEDRVRIKENPCIFIYDIERMMDVYDLNCWFDTITDTCNHLYSKYNPRLDIVIDSAEYQSLGIKNAIFCSHSNVQWTVYNIRKADENELYFNEQFDIDMFFIIEFLARRRNSHPNSLYFMNQYFTCSSEKGVFELRKGLEDEKQEDINEKMKTEDAIFKSMNINYAPDNSIDIVLERLYEKLNSKLQATFA